VTALTFPLAVPPATPMRKGFLLWLPLGDTLLGEGLHAWDGRRTTLSMVMADCEEQKVLWLVRKDEEDRARSLLLLRRAAAAASVDTSVVGVGQRQEQEGRQSKAKQPCVLLLLVLLSSRALKRGYLGAAVGAGG
jgi:hypothetical protein